MIAARAYLPLDTAGRACIGGAEEAFAWLLDAA